MILELLNETNQAYSTVEQIMYNRGINPNEFNHYLNTTDNDINDFRLLNESELMAGWAAIISARSNQEKAIVIVDCDCDGYCSAAILLNYLYNLFPSWTLSNVDYYLHSEKQHGLEDCCDEIISKGYKLVLIPDAGSNDYEYHKRLKDNDINVVCLDHHLADKISEYAIVINNQLSDYPNKEFCGAGITWQFCRYMDYLRGEAYSKNYANNLIDLVALANIGDMMSLHSIETRHLILKGLEKDNIHNPFIKYMLGKNEFPLSKPFYKSTSNTQACTGMGAAFFIVPFVNAITRTGTLEEKDLIFKSLLEYKAYEMIPEVKRGKQTGKEEMLVTQAIRVIGNVKNRQTRLEDEAMSFLGKKIEEEDLLDHRVLTFLLEDKNEVQNTIRGLVANKHMAKYQRPCMVLTKTDHGTYEGSMRGYTKNGLMDFKAALEQCDGVEWVQGHPNAAGCCLKADKIDDFIRTSDEILAKYEGEPVYRIDFLFNKMLTAKDKKTILDIAKMNDLWGQDFDRAYVGIKELNITGNNITLLSKDKNPTIRIKTSCGVDIMKFNSSQEEFDKLYSKLGSVKINLVGKCAINDWGGVEFPQIVIEDYEIVSNTSYYF